MNCVLLALPKDFTKFRLSPVEIMVYGYLHSFAVNDCDNFSTQKRLAMDLGYTVDAIKRARVKLKDKGLLLKANMPHRGDMINIWLPCMDLDLLGDILNKKIGDSDKIEEILSHVKNKQNSYINQILGETITTCENLGSNDHPNGSNDHLNLPNDHLNHVKRSPPEWSEIHLYNINEINLIYLFIINNNNLLDLIDLKDNLKTLTIEQIDFNFFEMFANFDVDFFCEHVAGIAEKFNSKNCKKSTFDINDFTLYEQLPFIKNFHFEYDLKNFFKKVTDAQNFMFDIKNKHLPHPLIFIACVLPLAFQKAGIDAVNELIAEFKGAYGLDFNGCVAECLAILKGL